MELFTGDAPVIGVSDALNQESSSTGAQAELPPANHQLDVADDLDQTNVTNIEVDNSTEQEELLISSLTQISDSNSNQFIMESHIFSCYSLPERVTTPDTYFCRICHQRSLSEPNLSPCNCRGTMGLIHRSCLEQWLATSDSNKCELCHFTFTVERQPRFGIFKALRLWCISEESRSDRLHLALDIIRMIVSLPIIFLINHVTAALFDLFHLEDTEGCDFYSFFQSIESQLNINKNIMLKIPSLKDVVIITGRIMTYLSVGFTSAVDIFAVGWVISRIEEHYSIWQKWYRTQSIVHVILPGCDEEILENK